MAALIVSPASLRSGPSQVASTPPMGWNSYQCFGWSVTEQEVRENAQYMADRLKEYGWNYVVVDFCWSFPGGGSQGNPDQGPGYAPGLAMDDHGRLLPDLDRFPSAKDGSGFKPLADHVHGLGLKFGIHVMRGIPRQAVAANAPVLGTKFGASDVADVNSTCPWLNHMFGLQMEKPGAQEYLDSIFLLYASWGVDFVKVDDLSFPYHAAEVEGYRRAINRCGRAMVFSTSPGDTPLSDAAHVEKNASMWRIKADFWDLWADLDGMFSLARSWNPWMRPGAWPDCDMLPLGKLAKRGPVGQERRSNFSADEKYTLMTLWSICRSPLFYGGNLPENDPATTAFITNRDVIAVNQAAESNRAIRSGKYPAWCANVAGSRDRYLALFNRTDSGPARVTVTMAELGIAGSCQVRDLWTGADSGRCSGTLEASVNAHGARLFRLYTGTQMPGL